MALQKRIAFVGLARQPVQGTPVTPPAFGLGMRGGAVLDPGLEQESDAITYGTRISPDENRTAFNPGLSIPTRLYPRSSGLLLYSALGAIASTPGTPNSHVITPAATLPRLTAYGQMDTEYHQIADCKLDTLKIAWARGPVDVDATLKGVTWTGYTSSWTPTADESGVTRFIAPGGTFQLHGRSNTPVDAAITGGVITISNNLVPIPLSKNIAPDDIFEAEQVIDVSFTLMPASTLDFRRAITDSDTGTTFSAQPVFGSFTVVFIIDPTLTKLTLTGTRVAFTPNYPEADPAGGPVSYTMAGRVKKPAASALTATLLNQTAGY